MYLRRPGGQLQFSRYNLQQTTSQGPINDLLAWLLENLTADLSVDKLVWSRLTRRWIVSPSKRDLAAALTCDDCLKNSLTSLQVNIVNDFTAVKWRKVILFCHLRHNLSVLI